MTVKILEEVKDSLLFNCQSTETGYSACLCGESCDGSGRVSLMVRAFFVICENSSNKNKKYKVLSLDAGTCQVSLALVDQVRMARWELNFDKLLLSV